MTNTVCPVGSLRADNDGDALRSTLLSDGRVFNIFNGFSHPVPDNCRRIFAQPQPIRNLVATLISALDSHTPTFNLTHVSNQLDGRDANQVGAELAINCQDASVLDVTRVVLKCGPLQTLTIKYDGSADSLSNCEPGDSHQITDAERKGAPQSILIAALALVNDGFRITGTDFDSAMRHFLFRKGDVVHSIDAELTWIV